jgi:hypothetical protein
MSYALIVFQRSVRTARPQPKPPEIQRASNRGPDVAPRFSPHNFADIPVGRPLPHPVRRQMESALKSDFSRVVVHEDDPRTEALDALAFTRGDHVHFAPGVYRPDAVSGRKILGHELAHVVQQRGGRVRTTGSVASVPLNDETCLESEADRLGDLAAAHVARPGSPRPPNVPLTSVTASADGAMQRKKGHRRANKLNPKQEAQRQRLFDRRERRMRERTAAERNLAYAAAESRLAKERVSGLEDIRSLHLVSSPAGGTVRPGRREPLPGPAPAKEGQEPLRYKDLTEKISGFLDPHADVRSVPNEGGPQFIQQFDADRENVTRRVGVDVEPSSHVKSLKPHLNLQTQFGGVIQGGELADPHHPVFSADPFVGGNPQKTHPLQGITPEEQLSFMERYLRSTGRRIARK